MPISINGIMTSCHYDVTKVVILGIEYRYRSLSSIEVSSEDVIAGIVLTLLQCSIPNTTNVSFRNSSVRFRDTLRIRNLQ